MIKLRVSEPKGHHLNIRRQIERGYILWMHIFIKIRLLKIPI